MAVGLHGQSGRLVLSYVEQGPKRELVHVPNQHLPMEVLAVMVMQKKLRRVNNLHVQVSVKSNNSCLFCAI